MDNKSIDPTEIWNMILSAALKMPGAKIDREKYLRKQLKGHCSEEQIEKSIDTSPKLAGVSDEIINKISNSCINNQSAKVSGLSALAGIPGGWVIAATIPADLVQFYFQAIQLIQKLAYIYGWTDLFELEDGTANDDSMLVLTLFLGVMLGATGANIAMTKLAQRLSLEVAKRLPQKALTKYAIYNLVKNVAKWIGIKITKDIFAKGLSKAIPIIGGVTSGTLSLITMELMGRKLAKHLKKMPQATNIIKKDNDKFDNQPLQIPMDDNKDYLLLLTKIKSLINLMKIDGKIKDEEKEFINKILEESNLREGDVDSFKNKYDDKSMYKIDYSIFADEPYESILLLTALVGLSKSDNEFHITEKMFIKEVAKELQFDDEDISEIIR